MKSCIIDFIVRGDDQLLYRRSLVNQKISEYFRPNGNSNGSSYDKNPNSDVLINAIEDLLRGYAFLGNVPDNTNDTLAELTRRVYYKQYGTIGVSISKQIEKDIEKVELDSTKNILREAKRFFDFQEGTLMVVYAENLRPTVASSRVKAL